MKSQGKYTNANTNTKKWHHYLLDYSSFELFLWVALIGEFLLNGLIIWKIPYTEIDWVAYMQEVEGVHNGSFDYFDLKGDTGPLVYPGAFVAIYYVLYLITGFGSNILVGQCIFALLYVGTIYLVLSIYKETKTLPLWAIFLVCISRRVHSIFVLRLFNDCFAMFFLYLSIYYILKERWNLGCVFYSIAVGVKMNVLLFAPGLFILLLQRFGVMETINKLSICAIIQVLISLPFVLTNYVAYLTRSFDLSRVFIYFWSVNWKFIPEQIFISREFGLVLLLVTLIVWFLFANNKWLPRGIQKYLSHPKFFPGFGSLNADYVVSVLFVSNFIGIVFSRSLHYQFYVWYFHTLPHLLWLTSHHVVIKLLVLLSIEIIWNIFPSNAVTSLVLFGLHLFLLFSLYQSPFPKPITVPDKAPLQKSRKEKKYN